MTAPAAQLGELCVWAALPLALLAATACLGATWTARGGLARLGGRAATGCGAASRHGHWRPQCGSVAFSAEGYGQAGAELDARLLRAWSLAAGELPGSASEGQAPAQGVER